jgi:hypothetical protein
MGWLIALTVLFAVVVVWVTVQLVVLFVRVTGLLLVLLAAGIVWLTRILVVATAAVVALLAGAVHRAGDPPPQT